MRASHWPHLGHILATAENPQKVPKFPQIRHSRAIHFAYLPPSHQRLIICFTIHFVLLYDDTGWASAAFASAAALALSNLVCWLADLVRNKIEISFRRARKRIGTHRWIVARERSRKRTSSREVPKNVRSLSPHASRQATRWAHKRAFIA